MDHMDLFKSFGLTSTYIHSIVTTSSEISQKEYSTKDELGINPTEASFLSPVI